MHILIPSYTPESPKLAGLPTLSPIIKHLLPLSIARLLTEGPSPNIQVHFLVVPDSDRAVDAGNVLNQPQHERVTPPRSVGVGGSLITTKANFAKSSLDKITGIGNQEARAADLAHGSSN
uniref:Uncharacterized protein n=1 Tax=Photinus pyralis TaxID=7054 RepID=A0A1Y1MR55_PHOPY